MTEEKRNASTIEKRPHRKNAKQVLVLRTDIEMDVGKMVSQGAHASVAAITLGAVYDPDAKKLTIDLSDASFESWLMLESFKKIVCGVKSESKLLALHKKAKDAGLRSVLIQDAGHTVFNNIPTYTAVSIGPHWPEDIDPITKKLQLLVSKKTAEKT